MSKIKSDKEIELMKISGKIAALALKEVVSNIKEGQTLIGLDKIAQETIEANGAQSSFKTVEDYKWTICTTVNDQVVHGIPNERKLNPGDIIGVDVGAIYNGYHSDTAITVGVGKVSQSDQQFLELGQKTLKAAIKKAQIGNTIGDISATIQTMVEQAGYSVVKNLTGHGVGKNLHEPPMVPGFGKSGTGLKLQENMALAIEVIYTKGNGKVHLEKDGWTISAQDGTLGGLFEQTIAVKKDGPIVLTPFL